MSGLFSIIATLARLSARQTAARAARLSVLVIVALVFALIGLAAFAAALWIVLARHLDPLTAALLLGGGSFVIAAVLLLVARRPHGGPFGQHDPQISQLMADLTQQGRGPMLWGPLVAAIVAGFMLTAGKDRDRK